MAYDDGNIFAKILRGEIPARKSPRTSTHSPLRISTRCVPFMFW